MPMKNPRHPGELVGENLHELGWNVSEAAEGLGISRQQLHKIISGRSAITPSLAVKLEKAIGSTAKTWLGMQAAHDLAQMGGTGAAGVRRFTPKDQPHPR